MKINIKPLLIVLSGISGNKNIEFPNAFGSNNNDKKLADVMQLFILLLINDQI